MAATAIAAMVVDENNQPLEDVNVFEMNKNEVIGSTKTSASGKFIFKVSSLENDLKFTRIGYKTTYQSISTTLQSKKAYMEQEDIMIEVVDIEAPKKSDNNLIYWILGALAVGAVIYKVKSKQPVKVKA